MTICFLKLGGSLITDKNRTDTANFSKLAAISAEIARALAEKPGLRLVIGHGSGSFGHHAAAKYHTRDGVNTIEDWHGFSNVWQKARLLNDIVIDQLTKANIPVIAFSPSSFMVTANHEIQPWSVEPLKTALEKQLVPVVYGDVVFDREIGGTIISTEEIFLELTQYITPDRVLVSGTEPGVWNNFDQKDFVLSTLTYPQFQSTTNMPSSSLDVTGGMGSKVSLMMKIAEQHPNTKIFIFSGAESGNIYSSLIGNNVGTGITFQERG